MDVDDIDTSFYTHIHFAFANLTADFKVDVSGAKDDFETFKTMTGVKRIISFGGWDFSASPGTFNILREAVKPANRETFKNNIVAFIQEHGLDGVDIDWEYPGVSLDTFPLSLFHIIIAYTHSLILLRPLIFPISLQVTPKLEWTTTRHSLLLSQLSVAPRLFLSQLRRPTGI